MSVERIAVWGVSLIAIAGVLLRPFGGPEAAYAIAGAGLLILGQFISIHDTLTSLHGGTDVYLFLTGMMLLSELARREGVFDWLAAYTLRISGTSRLRLFFLIYALGTAVTIFLSNDATAVVLTPAVAAVVSRAKINPLPYLFACAFIANAASFTLPISNPGNLVVFGEHLPPLISWLSWFLLPSLLAIIATVAVHALVERHELRQPLQFEGTLGRLSGAGRVALGAIAVAACVLVMASAWGIKLGLATLVVAVLASVGVGIRDREAPLAALRAVSWQTIALVGGLFILVHALENQGASQALRAVVESTTHLGALGLYALTLFVTALCNIGNNLPVGLLVGHAVASGVPTRFQHATAIAVDLGPNLSVSGSLATILWLMALRRDGYTVTFSQFFKVGMKVLPLALMLAVSVVR